MEAKKQQTLANGKMDEKLQQTTTLTMKRIDLYIQVNTYCFIWFFSDCLYSTLILLNTHSLIIW